MPDRKKGFLGKARALPHRREDKAPRGSKHSFFLQKKEQKNSYPIASGIDMRLEGWPKAID